MDGVPRRKAAPYKAGTGSVSDRQQHPVDHIDIQRYTAYICGNERKMLDLERCRPMTDGRCRLHPSISCAVQYIPMNNINIALNISFRARRRPITPQINSMRHAPLLPDVVARGNHVRHVLRTTQSLVTMLSNRPLVMYWGNCPNNCCILLYF